MSKLNKKTKLSFKELQDYLKDKSENRHAVELGLEQDALSADAMEGLALMNVNNIDADKINDDLKAKLNARLKEKEQKTVFFTWKNISVAASIVAILGFSTYLLFKPKTAELAVNVPKIETTKIEINEISKTQADVEKSEISKTKANKKVNPIPSKISEPLGKYDSETQATIIEAEDPVVNNVFKNEPVLAKSNPKPSAAPAYDKAEEEAKGYKSKVVDIQNNPIAGVKIVSNSGSFNTVTDANGEFIIPESLENDKITLKNKGYVSLEMPAKNAIDEKVVLTEMTSTVVKSERKSKAMKMPEQIELQEPMPQKGWKDFEDYVLSSVQISLDAISKEKILIINATVDIDGNISEVNVENSLSNADKTEIEKIIKKGPKWLAGRRKGKSVKQTVRHRIKIKE